jgi:hypothetical protein
MFVVRLFQKKTFLGNAVLPHDTIWVHLVLLLSVCALSDIYKRLCQPYGNSTAVYSRIMQAALEHEVYRLQSTGHCCGMVLYRASRALWAFSVLLCVTAK